MQRSIFHEAREEFGKVDRGRTGNPVDTQRGRKFTQKSAGIDLCLRILEVGEVEDIPGEEDQVRFEGGEST